MPAEMIVRIDPARWNEGLESVRELGQYDQWLQVWRVPVEGDWSNGVALCQRKGWVIATIIDAENRPVNWASPQYPAPGNPWYPCTAR